MYMSPIDDLLVIVRPKKCLGFGGVGSPEHLSWSLRGFVSEYSRCNYGIADLAAGSMGREKRRSG